MEPTKEIETVVIQGKRYLPFLYTYIVVGTALSLYCAFVLHSMPLMYIGLCVTILVPSFFSTQFRRGFTKKARLQFFPDHILIELSDKDTGAIVQSQDFPFADIVSFRTGDSSKDDSSFISLLLRDGRKFNYSFLGQREGDRSDDVTPNLGEHIRAYNNRPNPDHEIAYMPSMLASQGGKNMLIGLTVLLVVCVIVQIIVKPVSIPISMGLGLILYLSIFVQRKVDMDKAKAMNKQGVK
jgi:hypothetical protein